MSLLCAVHYPARVLRNIWIVPQDRKRGIIDRVEVGEIGRDNNGFPVKLRSELVKPVVKKLWYRGVWNGVLFTKCAAVVGSRRMSRYGKQALAEIVPRLCDAGYTIVSGLMYGVDQEAHTLTLECGGRAVGVLGYGITYKSEEGAMRLAKQIEENGGLVLSEYPGEAVCQRWMFPQRNRIVVGLSDIIVIAEAGEKSGTISTANWAKKMGKPVYAVPGSVFSPTSEGANWLVSEGMATALTKNMLEQLSGASANGKSQELEIGELSQELQQITTLLRLTGPMGVNDIARQMKVEVGVILAELLELEMKGVVEEERGVWKLC